MAKYEEKSAADLTRKMPKIKRISSDSALLTATTRLSAIFAQSLSCGDFREFWPLCTCACSSCATWTISGHFI